MSEGGNQNHYKNARLAWHWIHSVFDNMISNELFRQRLALRMPNIQVVSAVNTFRPVISEIFAVSRVTNRPLPFEMAAAYWLAGWSSNRISVWLSRPVSGSSRLSTRSKLAEAIKCLLARGKYVLHSNANKFAMLSASQWVCVFCTRRYMYLSGWKLRNGNHYKQQKK